jgi:hypothetical protein
MYAQTQAQGGPQAGGAPGGGGEGGPGEEKVVDAEYTEVKDRK